MTTLAIPKPTVGAPEPARDRHLVVENRVFAAASAVATIHAFDDAVLNRQPGVPLDQHAGALLVTAAVVTAGLMAFRRGRVAARAAIAATFGVLAVVNGAMHVVHVSNAGFSGSDVSGLAAAAAGGVLIILGALIPFLHRGEGDRSRRRRWANRVVATIASLMWGFMVLMPVGVAIGQTHMPRDPIGAPPSDRYVEVTFRSSDGLKLSGWYAPSRNRAAVIVVAGSGGDRLGSRQHAELLARHGYGVLLYDARGSGKSEGSPNGYGWGWNYDVRGAMTFLQRQPDVDSDRIGGLGLSTGADVLIRVAAEDRDLKAVVSDGATGASFDDLLPSARVATPFFWTLFTGVHLFSGTPPGPALEDLVPQVSPTPLLLIAAGSLPEEREFNAVYARVAREPFELWDLPHVNHNAAIRQVADEYEDRVIGHFDDALVDPANAQR